MELTRRQSTVRWGLIVFGLVYALVPVLWVLAIALRPQSAFTSYPLPLVPTRFTFSNLKEILDTNPIALGHGSPNPAVPAALVDWSIPIDQLTPLGRRHWRVLTLWAVTVVLFSTTALSVISGRNEPFYLSVVLMVGAMAQG